MDSPKQVEYDLSYDSEGDPVYLVERPLEYAKAALEDYDTYIPMAESNRRIIRALKLIRAANLEDTAELDSIVIQLEELTT